MLKVIAYLRLNGINAKEHAVFRELARVRQYFEKVENVEKLGSRRENLSLDKAAAGRMIKHALASSPAFSLYSPRSHQCMLPGLWWAADAQIRKT